MAYKPIITWIMLCFTLLHYGLCYTENSQEVCQYETFHAKCARGEVIFITRAYYGYIQVGRCIEVETDDMGCKADVADILSGKCDGRSECQVAHDDEEIRVLQPCRRGLSVYLTASYICIAAKQAVLCEPIHVTNEKRFISSKQSRGHVCPGPPSFGGLKNRLTTSDGRRIELSAVGFPEDDRENSNPVEIGYMLDERTDDVTSLMISPSGGRERIMMTSESNEATLSLHTHPEISFLLFFRAVGCEDMQKPKDMWLNRDQDQLTVGCHNSRKTWRLRCEGVHWRGVIGNCTKESVIAVAEITVLEEITMALPRDVVLMIIFSGTAIIALIIITAGYVTYKRSSLSLGNTQADVTLLQNNIKSSESSSKHGTAQTAAQGPQYTLMRLQENPTQSQPPPVPPRKDNLSAQTTLLMSNP